VHRVVNRRLHSSKRSLDLYEVKWLGFGDGHNTWEKRDSFLHKVRRERSGVCGEEGRGGAGWSGEWCQG
jgi:hypothetical protein